MRAFWKYLVVIVITSLILSAATLSGNAALSPVSQTVITGIVRDNTFNGHTYPLYARIVFSLAGSTEALVFTDPFTGQFRATLIQGQTYSVLATAVTPGYFAYSTSITPLNGSMVLDLPLTVTGDCSAYGYNDAALFMDTFDQVNAPEFSNGWSETLINASTSHWSTTSNVFDALPGFSSPNSLKFTATSGNSYTRLSNSLNLDLQSRTTAAVSFWLYQNNLNQASHDTVQLVVSNDAGGTWTPIDIPIERFSETTGWEYFRVDISEFAGVGKPTVQIGLLAYTGNGALNNIFIDNIRVGNYSCDTIPGGIIAGFVKNSQGSGISQARVYRAAAPATDFTYSFTTPDDQNIGNGLFILFSGASGNNDITVLQTRYIPKTSSGFVVQESVTRLDLTLESAEFTFTPSPLTVEVVGTGTQVQNLTITNFGHNPGMLWINDTISTSLNFADRPLQNAPQRFRPVTDTFSELPAIKKNQSQPILPKPARAQALSQLSSAYAPAIPGNPRIRTAVATCDGRSFYLFGGQNASKAFLDENWKFDITTGVWSRKAKMPIALMNMNAVCLGDSIYLVGGYNSGYTNNLLIYNTSTDNWSQSSTWQHERAPMLAGYKGTLYAFGGAPITNETYAYTPTTGWVQKAGMPVEVSFGSAVTVDDHIFIVGGVNAAGNAMTNVQRYDPIANVWETNGPNLPEGRSNGSAIWYGDHTIYLLGSGGRAGDAWSAWNDGLVYDTSLWPNGTWTRLPGGSLSTPMDAGAGICLGGRIWMLGGVDANTSVANAIEVYNTNQFIDYGLTCHPSLPAIPWLNLNTNFLSLASEESGQLTLTFKGSSVTKPGLYRGLLRINSDSPFSYPDIPVQMIRVEKGAGIGLAPQSGVQTGHPHKTLSYDFTVTNTSAIPTNFPITISNLPVPTGWAVNIFPTSTGILAPAQSKQISVQVTLPSSGVANGTVFPLNLAIGSTLDPIHYGTATFITTLDYFTFTHPFAFR